jgi:ribonuclease HI
MSGRREYLCYTDGSAKAGDGAPGGWGFHIQRPSASTDAPIEGSGKAIGTLAKIMEHHAVAAALEALPDDARAIVLSDNQPMIESLSKNLATWAARDFANVDPLIAPLARRIANAITTKRLTITWQWIRSHNGNVGNERADFLATRATREAKADLQRR